VARRTKLSEVNLKDLADFQKLRARVREEIFIPSGGDFRLHPGDFVLGATLEFVALPYDLVASVEGRSSIGRMGLFVATAAQIAPGFHGVVVLELANTGTVPLVLSPTMPIAQLVLHVTTEQIPREASYRGQYQCQIKP
jgi:dCTP deaminase